MGTHIYQSLNKFTMIITRSIPKIFGKKLKKSKIGFGFENE